MKLNIDLTQGKPRNVFFTSDFHLFHTNVLRFDNRPFTDVYEMHDVITNNWNSIVKPNDVVIYLGDLSFSRANDNATVEALVKKLNGTVHFILGNHDKFEQIKKLDRFASIQDYLELKIRYGTNEEMLFCCMHYPIYTWNKCHYGSIMLHGHCHMSLSGDEFHKTHRIYDVGCNGYDYYPVPFNKFIELGKNVDYKITSQHH